MNELIQYETDHGEVQLSHEIVRKYLVSGGAQVTDQEIVMFINLCKFQQLNPFLREAYLIKYSASEPATMVTGKDTFTKRAQKNKMFRGFKAGIIVSTAAGKISYRDGSMVIKGETLVGGWAEIYVEGWTVPLRNEVSFDEYCAKNAKGEPNRQWRRMPGTMIRKVALVQALREAFPQDFQGMYDSAEMGVEGLPEKNVTPNQEPEQKPETEPEPENPKDAFRKRLREIAALYLNPAFTDADRKDAKEKLAAINDAMDSVALEAFAVATQARIDGINGKPEEKPAEPEPAKETTDEPAEKELDIF